MKVIRPVDIPSSKIISTTAVETYTTYAAGTTYALAARVVYGDHIYESLVASNVGNTPNISPTKWLLVGPNNKYAMFDMQVSTQTQGSSPLSVVLATAANITSVAVVNAEALSITVSVLDAPAGNLVYSETISLDDTIITDWYEYFFEDYDIRNDAVFENIPPYINSRVTISFDNGTSIAKVGAVVLGTPYVIGDTQYGISYGIRDYSIKETNEYGTTEFVERNYSKRMEPSVFIDNSKLNAVSKILTQLRAKPTVWSASDDSRFQGAIVYGFLKDWNVEISYPTASMLSLQIEGLT